FVFSRKLLVSNWCENLHLGQERLKNQIKSNLIVSGTGTSVSDIIGIDGFGVSGNGHRLENAFRTDRQRLCPIFKYIAIKEKTHKLVIVFVGFVDVYVCISAQLHSFLFYFFHLIGGKSATIDEHRIDFEILILEILKAVRGV